MDVPAVFTWKRPESLRRISDVRSHLQLKWCLNRLGGRQLSGSDPAWSAARAITAISPQGGAYRFRRRRTIFCPLDAFRSR